MAKFDHRQLSAKERTKLLDELWDNLFSLDSKEEMKSFFNGLLTSSEKVMLARRLKIAKQLMEGKSYLEVREQLGVGLSTIEYVDRWLARDFEDYRNTFPAMLKKTKKPKNKYEKDSAEKWSFKELRHKYPAHFLLFNLLLDD